MLTWYNSQAQAPPDVSEAAIARELARQAELHAPALPGGAAV